jgi:hypothetical protein
VVKETEFAYYAQDDFRVKKPKLQIYYEGTPRLGVAHEIYVRVENPLPKPLTKCVFKVEGSGIYKPFLLKVCNFY